MEEEGGGERLPLAGPLNGLGGLFQEGQGQMAGTDVGQKTTAVPLYPGSHCHPTGTPTASEKTSLSESVIHLL